MKKEELRVGNIVKLKQDEGNISRGNRDIYTIEEVFESEEMVRIVSWHKEFKAFPKKVYFEELCGLKNDENSLRIVYDPFYSSADIEKCKEFEFIHEVQNYIQDNEK